MPDIAGIAAWGRINTVKLICNICTETSKRPKNSNKKFSSLVFFCVPFDSWSFVCHSCSLVSGVSFVFTRVILMLACVTRVLTTRSNSCGVLDQNLIWIHTQWTWSTLSKFNNDDISNGWASCWRENKKNELEKYICRAGYPKKPGTLTY